MKKRKAQKLVAIIWMIVFLILTFLLLRTSLTNKFQDRTKEVYDWFSHFFLPGFSVIVGAFLLNKPWKIENQPKNIEGLPLWLAGILSIIYPAILLTVFLCVPVSDIPLDPFTRSRPITVIVQPFAMMAIGFFFTNKK